MYLVFLFPCFLSLLSPSLLATVIILGRHLPEARVIHVFPRSLTEAYTYRSILPDAYFAMADTKRQNAGGKYPVATPQIGASGMVSIESAMSCAIGAR